MDKETENWPDAVFGSMKGSQRARPKSDLFEKIKAEVNQGNTKIISLAHRRRIIAAAAVVLLVNLSAIIYHQQKGQLSLERSSITMAEVESTLINDFQIYAP